MKALIASSDQGAGDGSLKLWGKISHLWICCMHACVVDFLGGTICGSCDCISLSPICFESGDFLNVKHSSKCGLKHQQLMHCSPELLKS